MFKRFSGAIAARRMLLERSLPLKDVEELDTSGAVDRVAAEVICSPASLPSFDRSAMDGYAVRSTDTRGAKLNAPCFIQDFIPLQTGMVVPEGYDAVVMLEDARIRGEVLEVTAEAHPYKNVARTGEDVMAGDVIFPEGHRLRPPDLALLSALGVGRVRVYAKPDVVIIPTGDGLVDIGARSLNPGEAYEINGLMARLYAERWGADVQKTETVPGDAELIREAIRSNLDADMIIIIGGSSVGERDYAPRIISEMGELYVHGVRLQPGKPTALGVISGKQVVCLPGYPVAALSNLYLFIRPAIKRMAHLSDKPPRVQGRLARKMPSKPGYLSLVRVAIGEDGQVEPIMVSGAGILSSVARADGFVVVPEPLEGFEEGDMVEVVLYE
ncbi:molybdopterin molybdotransferase MoeA [Methanothrix sp.]|uniref:molybdopterin molybdotransferase MoeA n=1 Tax=Methanothrix sp. TaxID=90426 RepID=UPI003C78A6D1